MGLGFRVRQRSLAPRQLHRRNTDLQTLEGSTPNRKSRFNNWGVVGDRMPEIDRVPRKPNINQVTRRPKLSAGRNIDLRRSGLEEGGAQGRCLDLLSLPRHPLLAGTPTFLLPFLPARLGGATPCQRQLQSFTRLSSSVSCHQPSYASVQHQ